MRKILAAAVLGVTVSSGAALAGDPDVGCGWGTTLFNGRKGVAPKVMAATTNGCLGSQTFGITSGTAGCTRGGVVKAEAQLNMYAGANIDQLASDMAAGQGEALDTLAYLLRIADADKPAFFRLAKSSFGVLFPSDQVTAGEMLGALNGVMAADRQLAKYAS
jgi:hypothetical protein